jgi:hypothetical protein
LNQYLALVRPHELQSYPFDEFKNDVTETDADATYNHILRSANHYGESKAATGVYAKLFQL